MGTIRLNGCRLRPRYPVKCVNPVALQGASLSTLQQSENPGAGHPKEPLNSAIFAHASVGRAAFGGLAPEIHGDFRLSEASSSLFRDAGQTPPPNLKRPV